MNANENLGVWKKMAAQRKVFSKYYTVSYTYMRDHHFWIRKGEKETDLGELRFIGRIYCLRLLLNYYKKIGQVPNFMYVRYTMSDWNVIKLLKYLKSKGTKTIIEIPTYPYEAECKDSVQDYVSLGLDRYYRKKLCDYVKYILSYGDIPSKIYGVDTLTLKNGVDCSTISVRTVTNASDTINLLMVANFAPWHGCERLLKGLYDYKSGGGIRKICIYLVGNGNEIDFYRQLTKQYAISGNVVFCGMQQGDALEDYYNLADIGIDSLAGYKKGISVSSSLKSKEYLVKGLPVVLGCKIDILSDSLKECTVSVPNDASHINMQLLIDFYDRLYKDNDLKLKQNVADYISKIGIETCNIYNTMQPIMNIYRQ